EAANVEFRAALESDVAPMTTLIASAGLPPVFVAEWLGGFIAAEREGAVVACGGIEMYEDCGVIRSVVVAESARGLGLGGLFAERLMALGRERGARDLYLFTADAHPCWVRYGFTYVAFEAWKQPARASWHYQFLSQNRDFFAGGHTMWRAAD